MIQPGFLSIYTCTIVKITHQYEWRGILICCTFGKIIKTAKDSGGSAHTESTQLTISSVMEMFLTHTKSSITLLTPALYCIIVEAEYVFVIFYGS